MLKSSKVSACGGHSLGQFGSSNLQFCPQIPLCEFIEILPLILTFIAKSLLLFYIFFCAKILKIFACGGHSLGHRTYSLALKPHFVNSLKILPLMTDTNRYYQISSTSFCVLKFSKFSPAAGIHWVIELTVLPSDSS